MRRLLLAVGLILTAAAPASAQDAPLWGWLRIRASTSDQSLSSQPAGIMVQWPKDAPAAVALDAGLAGNVLRKSTVWSFEPTFEIHKHTAIDAPQETLYAGGTLSRIVGDPAEGLQSWYDGSLEFKHDGVAGTKGLQATFAWRPVAPDAAIGAARGPDGFKWSWQPVATIEFEDLTAAPTGDPTGEVTRAHVGLDLVAFPWSRRADNRFQVTVIAKVWSELSRSAALGPADREIHLAKVAFTGYFDHARHFGVGLEGLTGADPSQGLRDQRYWQIALKILY